MDSPFFLVAALGFVTLVLAFLLIRKSTLCAQLGARLARAEAEAAFHERSTESLSTTFKALSLEALDANNHRFLDVAHQAFQKLQGDSLHHLSLREKAVHDMVVPVREALEKVSERIQVVEKERLGAYEGLKEQVQQLLETQRALRSETTNLVQALKKPMVRGRWGEIQLKRVIEMAGMLAYCDFREQRTVSGEEGALLRPDVVVQLPGGNQIVIDAKAPMMGYLESLETGDDDEKRKLLADHARHVRTHIKALSTRAYWSQFETSPEFVVLFLPGETFFSAALQADPSLIEMGVEHKVILATPTTLIALLKAVAYGWKQESLRANAQEISQLGQLLYERLSDMTGMVNKMGRHLGGAVQTYNQMVGSFEQRVMVSARRFQELGIRSAKKTMEPLEGIDSIPRDVLGAAVPMEGDGE